MNRLHKQRVLILLVIVSSIAVAVGLGLFALQNNINLFYSPTQIKAGMAPMNHVIRLGGLVEKGSVRHATQQLQVSFVVMDQNHRVPVDYKGILPDLFREGQSVVVEGKLDAQGTFIAGQVLAKHDEKYRPAQCKQVPA